jgi:uncharacterized FAD-dependent dehydrogenase
MVVAINPPDWRVHESKGALAALTLQQEVEQRFWRLSGQTQAAAAQRVEDFFRKKVSTQLNETSYQPGLVAADLNEVLPDFLAVPLQDGLGAFGKKMRGYSSNLGQMIGMESRTSSPVKIPRDPETLEHPFTQRLFPCGEGAGYAGGIMSAAMDGERCAEKLAEKYRISQ